MKLKAVMALLGLVLILTGCTRVNANIIEDTKQDEEETKMTEISGEIGVDGIQKTIKMPIPEDLSEFLYFESLPAGKGSILLVMFENGDEAVSIGNFAMYTTLE